MRLVSWTGKQQLADRFMTMMNDDDDDDDNNNINNNNIIIINEYD